MRYLTAVPVYNEEQHVDEVLNAITSITSDVLVIDDGSTDGTADRLSCRDDVFVLRHKPNRGYGAALKTAFRFAVEQRYDGLITLDCDGQHQPQLIPDFVRVASQWDIVSGSRYLSSFESDAPAPAERRSINLQITAELNDLLGFALTDAFCGFKAYRVDKIARLNLIEDGYAMPLELWVQASNAGLRITELPVPRIYLDERRSFGDSLDDAGVRLAHYRKVITDSMQRIQDASSWCCDEIAMANQVEC